MGKRRRTEIAKIANPAARLVTYSKRRQGLFKKASDLSILCGVRIAVIVFSAAGRLCSFGSPSAEEVVSEYLRGHGDVVPPTDLTRWDDRLKKELDSCATKEDLESLIAKFETLCELLLKDEEPEKNSSVTFGAGGDSASGFGFNSENLSTFGAGGDSASGFGFNSENLSDQDLDSVLDSFKACCPALFEDCPCDLEDSGFNPDSFLNLDSPSAESN